MQLLNINPQAIELDQSCTGQAHSIRPGTGPGYGNTEPGCILTKLRVPFIIRLLKSADAKSARLFKSFRTAGTNGRQDLSLF